MILPQLPSPKCLSETIDAFIYFFLQQLFIQVLFCARFGAWGNSLLLLHRRAERYGKKSQSERRTSLVAFSSCAMTLLVIKCRSPPWNTFFMPPSIVILQPPLFWQRKHLLPEWNLWYVWPWERLFPHSASRPFTQDLLFQKSGLRPEPHREKQRFLFSQMQWEIKSTQICNRSQSLGQGRGWACAHVLGARWGGDGGNRAKSNESQSVYLLSWREFKLTEKIFFETYLLSTYKWFDIDKKTTSEGGKDRMNPNRTQVHRCSWLILLLRHQDRRHPTPSDSAMDLSYFPFVDMWGQVSHK